MKSPRCEGGKVAAAGGDQLPLMKRKLILTYLKKTPPDLWEKNNDVGSSWANHEKLSCIHTDVQCATDDHRHGTDAIPVCAAEPNGGGGGGYGRDHPDARRV